MGSFTILMSKLCFNLNSWPDGLWINKTVICWTKCRKQDVSDTVEEELLALSLSHWSVYINNYEKNSIQAHSRSSLVVSCDLQVVWINWYKSRNQFWLICITNLASYTFKSRGKTDGGPKRFQVHHQDLDGLYLTA